MVPVRCEVACFRALSLLVFLSYCVPSKGLTLCLAMPNPEVVVSEHQFGTPSPTSGVVPVQATGGHCCQRCYVELKDLLDQERSEAADRERRLHSKLDLSTNLVQSMLLAQTQPLVMAESTKEREGKAKKKKEEAREQPRGAKFG